MALPNKTSPELIYKPNTKGPWSDTRGPGIGVHGPRSCASAVGIRHSTPTVAPRTVAHGQPFGSPFVAQAPVWRVDRFTNFSARFMPTPGRDQGHSTMQIAQPEFSAK